MFWKKKRWFIKLKKQYVSKIKIWLLKSKQQFNLILIFTYIYWKTWKM